jgi:hypothetical protein
MAGYGRGSCWMYSGATRPPTDRRTLDKAGVMRYT